MENNTRKTVWRRLGLIMALLPVCFIFPITIIFLGFLAWTIYEDLKPSQYPHEPPPHTWRDANPEANDWLKLYCNQCESPAETAFLKAMITAHGLVPNQGMLQGIDFRLELQVKIPPYRVDFLINRWLVVEIDGATYHSSPEAIERDKSRDKLMQERGYVVLRIPASVVFATPDDAVNRVEAMLSRKGSAAIATPDINTKSNNKRNSIWTVLSGINDALSTINASVGTQSAIKKYTQGHVNRFHAERLAINTAIALAESEIRANQFMAQSNQHRESYLAAYEQFRHIFESEAQHNDQAIGTGKLEKFIAIPALPRDEAHPDPSINEAILRARQNIFLERDSFFNITRSKMSNDEALKSLVREKLNELGCSECWQYLS